jgi:hypothetical protein
MMTEPRQNKEIYSVLSSIKFEHLDQIQTDQITVTAAQNNPF